MGASAQGGMKPQQPQQRPMVEPMGRQPQQGKGPGLPMPQKPQMGGNRPYQPVGANNGPFNPNPVQPVNQPPQMLDQIKQMYQGQPQPQVMPQVMPMSPQQSPYGPYYDANGRPTAVGTGGPGAIPMQPQVQQPSNMSPEMMDKMKQMQQIQSGQNMGQSAQMQPRGNDSFSGSNMPQGKGPQSPFANPAQTGPVQPGMVPNQGKGPM